MDAVTSDDNSVFKNNGLLLYKNNKFKNKYKFGSVEFRRYISTVGPNSHNNKAFLKYFDYEEMEAVAKTRKSLDDLHFSPITEKKFGVTNNNPFNSCKMPKAKSVRYAYCPSEMYNLISSSRRPVKFDFYIGTSSSKDSIQLKCFRDAQKFQRHVTGNILKASKFKPIILKKNNEKMKEENKDIRSEAEKENLHSPKLNLIASYDIDFQMCNFEQDYENARMEFQLQLPRNDRLEAHMKKKVSSVMLREGESCLLQKSETEQRENVPAKRKFCKVQSEETENLKVTKIAHDNRKAKLATRMSRPLYTKKEPDNNTGNIQQHGQEPDMVIVGPVRAKEVLNVHKGITKTYDSEKLSDKRRVSYKEAEDDINNMAGPSIINESFTKLQAHASDNRLYCDQTKTNGCNESKKERIIETAKTVPMNEGTHNMNEQSTEISNFWRVGYQEVINCYKEFENLLITYLTVLLKNIPGALAGPPPWPLQRLLNTLKRIYICYRQIPYIAMKIILYLDQSEVVFYRGDLQRDNLKKLYIQNVLRPLIDAGIHLMRAIPRPLCNTGMVSYIKLLHLAEKVFGPNKHKLRKENISESTCNIIRTTGRNVSLITIKRT